MPVAAVGAAYFLLLTTWFLFVGLPNESGRIWHQLILIVCSAGLLGSVYFTFMMATRLPVWCTWCLAVHAINAVLFVAAVLASPRVMPHHARPIGGEVAYPSFVRASATLIAGLTVVSVFGLASFAYNMQLTARQFQLEYLKAANDVDYIQWQYSRQPRQNIEMSADDLIDGPADAPSTLVVYGDFECSKCNTFHQYTRRLRNLFPKSIRVVSRHYPMSQACNPHVTSQFHLFSCEAARVAMAVRRISTVAQALKYEDLLYKNQLRLDERPYAELAAAAGVDAGKLAEAVEDSALETLLTDAIKSAKLLGVDATPTIFLNGRRLSNWQIVTNDAKPRLDLAATDQLWRRLLNIESTSRPVSTR